MINVNFEIGYPWWNDKFKSFFSRAWQTLIKHKYFEIELLQDNLNLFHFQFNWTTKQDHAGIKLELGLFGYELWCHLYDSRHWDYTNNCWMSYENKPTR
jgi:hypothetical protein